MRHDAVEEGRVIVQPSCVVAQRSVVIGCHRDLIGPRVHPFDARVVPRFNTRVLLARL